MTPRDVDILIVTVVVSICLHWVWVRVACDLYGHRWGVWTPDDKFLGVKMRQCKVCRKKEW